MEINEILEISPYSLSKDQKRELLNNRLHELTRKHYEQCLPYRRMMDAMELDSRLRKAPIPSCSSI